jgi:cytoskeletal protein CcmA (bactofilin family)
MFLKRIQRNISSRGASERGSAILAVLGVMGVTMVIAVTTTTASLHAVGITTSTRASVEAEAAAEAGIDYTASMLATSVCQAQYTRSTSPIFSVVVSYSNLATSPGTTDTSWVSGCPSSTSAQRIKLVSTGTASSLGVAGNTTGNIRKVEAIYPYTPSPPAYTITPSGPATYSYLQLDSTINNLTITQAGTVRPTMVYLSGSATCTSGSQITGDVILGGGGLSITSGCTINGDLSTAGVVNISSGDVTGNVNAAGVQSGTSVSVGSSAEVDGSIYGAGPVSISGEIGGNVVAGPTAGTSTFSNHSSVGGSVVSAGTVSAATGSIKGTITQNKTGIVTPVVPFAPQWVDYAYSPSDWVASNGNPYLVLTMISCTANILSTSLATLAASASPMILDTRVCGSVTDFSGYNMSLTSDSVILANGFKFNSNNIQSSSAPDKRLWIIIPDTVADRQPTCPSGSSATIGNNVHIGPHVAAMIYSPCAISNGGDVWTGQMYSSSIGTSSSFLLNFLQIGLPTVNLSTGQYLAPTGTGVLGDRTSIRDLVSN